MWGKCLQGVTTRRKVMMVRTLRWGRGTHAYSGRVQREVMRGSENGITARWEQRKMCYVRT